MEESKFEFNEDEINHLIQEFGFLEDRTKELCDSNAHIFESNASYATLAKMKIYKARKCFNELIDCLGKLK